MYTQKNRFGIVNREVITDPNLSIGAKTLYSVLSCYANKQRTCFPSINTLADDTSSSQSSIDRWIKELKTFKYIKRVGRKLTIK
jgi:hypothetical protein